MRVFVAGRGINYEQKSWTLVGVFSSEELAAAACKAEGEHHGTEYVWYHPMELDVAAPIDDTEVPDAVFPLVEQEA